MDVKDHELIEDLHCVLHRSCLVFYFWMRSKFPKGATVDEICRSYCMSKRTILRYLSHLKKEELVTRKEKPEIKYIPSYAKTS